RVRPSQFVPSDIRSELSAWTLLEPGQCQWLDSADRQTTVLFLRKPRVETLLWTQRLLLPRLCLLGLSEKPPLSRLLSQRNWNQRLRQSDGTAQMHARGSDFEASLHKSVCLRMNSQR